MDVRCKKCNKLLGKIDGAYEIKCPRCGEINKSFEPHEYEEEVKKLILKMHSLGIHVDEIKMSTDAYQLLGETLALNFEFGDGFPHFFGTKIIVE
jgi:LSD1 subclass zinc finger protein